jgi:cytochrome b6-f complex iron-sulfur subunit
MNRHETRGRRLLRLFPRAWRARYEQEFLALIEDRPPGVRDALDIVLSACDARLRPQAWAVQSEARGQLMMQSAGDGPAPVKITLGGAPMKRPARPERSGDSRRFSRRTFLRNAVLGGAVVAGAGTTVAALTFSWPNETGVFGKEVVIPKESIPPAGAAPLKHLSGKFWLMHNADGALALYWKCPHLGCTVPWEEGEGQFHCPCHQSIYDRNGVLISGPAPRPMDLMALRQDELGNVIVDTGQIIVRDRYTPEQAVRLRG